MALKERGVVKWFNDAKGFGFIEHSSGQDVFVHYSVIEWDGFKTLKDGEEVNYELAEGDKGLHAAKVTRVKSADTEESTSEASAVSNTDQVALNNSNTADIEVSITSCDSESSISQNPSLDASSEPSSKEESVI